MSTRLPRWWLMITGVFASLMLGSAAASAAVHVLDPLSPSAASFAENLAATRSVLSDLRTTDRESWINAAQFLPNRTSAPSFEELMSRTHHHAAAKVSVAGIGYSFGGGPQGASSGDDGWLMWLVGIALVGYQLRRKQRHLPTPFAS